jgi:hypothetical protein
LSAHVVGRLHRAVVEEVLVAPVPVDERRRVSYD